MMFSILSGWLASCRTAALQLITFYPRVIISKFIGVPDKPINDLRARSSSGRLMQACVHLGPLI